MNAIQNPPPVNGVAGECTCLNRFDHCEHCRAVEASVAAEEARRKAEAPAKSPPASVLSPAPRAPLTPAGPPAPPPPMPPLVERWLTAEEAAVLLAIGVRTLWRLVEEGRCPQPVRYSRKLVRFSGAKLAAWMQQQADDAQRAG